MNKRTLLVACVALLTGCGLVADLGSSYTADDAGTSPADAVAPDAPSIDVAAPDAQRGTGLRGSQRHLRAPHVRRQM